MYLLFLALVSYSAPVFFIANFSMSLCLLFFILFCIGDLKLLEKENEKLRKKRVPGNHTAVQRNDIKNLWIFIFMAVLKMKFLMSVSEFFLWILFS